MGGRGAGEIGTHILRYFLKNVDNLSEGKIILNCNFILKNLKCSIHKNSALLLEKPKPTPRCNTVILTNVTSVTIAKQSDRDTEPASFGGLCNLYIT